LARDHHPARVKGSHVSNTRHAKDAPASKPPLAALPPPPSPDVAQHGLAQVIGQAVALHLAEMLGQLLPAMPWQPDCFFCLLGAKKTVRDHQVAIANAQAAGEEMPALPDAPSVNRAVTQVVVTQLVPTPAGLVPSSGSVWACWDHLELPSEPPRQSGLVDVAGRPIAARR
jgi:hypothetical protein